MPQYLLAVHAPADAPVRPDPPSEQLDAWFDQVQQLEDEMAAAGAWVFSGRLTDPGSATVVRSDSGGTMTTDGPYLETKEHVAGFYVIDAADLDAALDWAGRVTACIGAPIEVRPFAATGRVERPAR